MVCCFQTTVSGMLGAEFQEHLQEELTLTCFLSSPPDFDAKMPSDKNALVTIPSKISGGMDLPTDTFANRGGSVSMLSYQPKSQMDYGTVLCAARNSVGSQLVPCVYHVIPAGTHSCSYRKDFIFRITLPRPQSRVIMDKKPRKSQIAPTENGIFKVFFC